MQMVTSAAASPSDVQLVAASRFDGVHFVAIFDRHAAAVHGYLARRLGDAAGAAHLGAAFAAAYAARRHFRGCGESARPWLLGVATGIVRRQWRQEQDRLRSLSGRADIEGAATIAEHLQHLAARDRDLVLLAGWEEQPPVAVAMALDLPDGTVTTRTDRLADEVAGLAPRRAGSVGGAAEGLERLRMLRPDVSALDEVLLGAVRHDLQVLTGQRDGRGGARSTVSVAAEHEQRRRWLARPGASMASRGRR